jgi:type II secretion system protein G
MLLAFSFTSSRADSDSSAAGSPATQAAATTDPAASDDRLIVFTHVQVGDLRTAIEEFNLDNGRYPTTAEGLNELVYDTSHLPAWHQYLPHVPRDPWGNAYIYRCPGKGDHAFDVYSCGPSGVDQGGAGDNIQ